MKFFLFSICFIIFLTPFICLHNERNRGKYKDPSSSPKTEAKNIKNQFGQIANSTLTTKNKIEFQKELRFNDFFLKDKEIIEIYEIISGNSPNKADSDAMRSFFSTFIENFDKCTSSNKNLLSKEDFTKCIQSDTYFTQTINSTDKSITDLLYNLLEDKNDKGISFFGYLLLRLFRFSWAQCSTNSNFIEEANFECAIQIASGFSGLSSGVLHRIFDFSLNFGSNKTERYLDFATYCYIASSMKLFNRINGKIDQDISVREMRIAIDHNILPRRYSTGINEDLFKVIEENKGIDLFSFIFYDLNLMIFEKPSFTKDKASRYIINEEEFVSLKDNTLFNRLYNKTLTLFLLANMTQSNTISSNNSSQSSAGKEHELNVKESSHLLLSFIQRKSRNRKNKNQRALDNGNTNNQSNDSKDISKVLRSVFNIMKNNNKNYLEFYEFITFAQTCYLFGIFDKYDKGKISAYDLYNNFSTYYDYPSISHRMKNRSKLFSLYDPNIYFDFVNTLIGLSIEDIIQQYKRNSATNLFSEIEMNQILLKIGFSPLTESKNCIKETGYAHNVPLYDWECVFNTALNNVLTHIN